MYQQQLNNLYISNANTGEIAHNSSVLSIECFENYKPDSNTTYFKNRITSTNRNLPTFIVGIVFYNEDVKEIKRTLYSIGEQLTEMRDICSSQVIIVGDGVTQMDDTTKNYLFSLYCHSAEDIQKWNEMINDLFQSEDKTYVIQRCIQLDSSLCCIKLKKHQYPMTLVLKSENRRKHNSQEWILNSFATQSFTDNLNFDAHFIFMTDCGTLFDPYCLYRLLKYLIAHPKCVGTTARQRVMTAKEQDMANESWISVAKFLRIIQLADYEISYATYTGAFSAAGCLPVLPGPCALFRYSGLVYNDRVELGLECALKHYNNLIDTPIENTNICIENVKLAEDRIPSYAVVTHGQAGAYTTWVDGAIFKFQAETTMEKLILQRRRWINGALSCYVWNCFVHPSLILKSNHNVFRKCFILLLYFMQFLNYMIAMCTYGVLAGSLYISLLSLFDLDSKIVALITCFYGCVGVNHLIVHKFYVYSCVLTYITAVVNSIAFGFVITGFIHEIISWGDLTGLHDNIGRTMIIYSSVIIVSIPLIMAILSLNLKSMFYIVFSFIPYIIFLPTLVGTFVMYSIARLADITWGNRVSLAKSSFHGASDSDIKILKSNFNIISGFVLLAVIILNIGVALILIFFYTTPIVIGAIMVGIVLPLLLQCLISMVYFIVKHASCQSCKQKLIK